MEASNFEIEKTCLVELSSYSHSAVDKRLSKKLHRREALLWNILTEAMEKERSCTAPYSPV